MTREFSSFLLGMKTPGHRLFLVRRSPTHCVVAHAKVHRIKDGTEMWQLLRVTPDTGTVPDIKGLTDGTFSSMSALRQAILARMEG